MNQDDKILTAEQYLSWVMVRNDLCRNNPLAEAIVDEALERGVSPYGPALSVALRDGKMCDGEYAFCEWRGVSPLLYVQIRKQTGLTGRQIIGAAFDVPAEKINLHTSGRMTGVNTDGGRDRKNGRVK